MRAGARNILLVLFFRELKEDAKAKESLDDNWLRVVGRAGKSLAQHPSRIYTDAQLGAVQNIGPRLKQIVKDNLWVLYPPDPPSEQELQEEAEQEQAQRRQKQAEKEERRRKRTAEKEQQRRADACGVAGVDALGVPAVGYGGSSAAGAGEAEEAGGPKRKKQKTAKEPKAKKSYCPGLGTANYAFLVELFKAHHNGEEFLSKKQLMDRAGASGLSNKPIYGSQPAHGVAGVQQFTYDGWSNMKTLVNGDPPLVISYSGEGVFDLSGDMEAPARTGHGVGSSREAKDAGISDEDLARMLEMGYSIESATKALRGNRTVAEAVEVIEISDSDDDDVGKRPSPAPAAKVTGGLLARLESRGSGTARAGLPPRPTASSGAGRTGSGPLSGRAPPVPAAPAASRHASGPPGQASAAASQQNGGGNGDVGTRRLSTGSQQASGSGRLTRDVARHGEAHTSSAYRGIWNLPPFGGQYGMTETDVRLPPLSQGRRFGDEYEVVLILDQREQFSRAGGAGRTESLMQHVQAMTNQGLKLEVRQLEVGDALWVARSLRSPGAEYVLDFIVERKSAGDLEASILDARYEKQKYHLRRCGVRHVLYLLEGDPDQRLRPQHLKTACMTTDIIDGFRVMRTESIGATVRLYKALTDTIKGFYAPLSSSSLEVQRGGQPLVSFAAFKTQTIAVKKTTVRDIWGLMLTAVPGVGPDMAEAVLRKYPTPRSLFEAYRSTMLAARARNLDVTAAANKLLLGTEISKGRAFSINQSTKVFSTLFANAWQL
ncbi:hypothetical protein WJX72_000382 [[Myrmecia] bisecta]|uniref:Crossover junction endonuclease MUS81 n=1 Tax=[Myrmecia] bisecta TaxID=41462 RepID=A0AAW1R3Y3_9CHLO